MSIKEIGVFASTLKVYLELECELPDEECNIFVKLK